MVIKGSNCSTLQKGDCISFESDGAISFVSRDGNAGRICKECVSDSIKGMEYELDRERMENQIEDFDKKKEKYINIMIERIKK
jgi:hypothetical protein